MYNVSNSNFLADVVNNSRKIQDDSVLLSSESEASVASYTDSGIPQTETITSSPIDMDIDNRSEKVCTFYILYCNIYSSVVSL